jgi:hypothetical protein
MCHKSALIVHNMWVCHTVIFGSGMYLHATVAELAEPTTASMIKELF